jgi:hypothetical protein
MWQPIEAETEKHWRLHDQDWPVLIHGAEQAGSSFFTIALTADLVRSGEKVVFLCARGQGVRSLEEELGGRKPDLKIKQVDHAHLNELTDLPLITFFSKSSEFLLNSLRALPDWDERVVVLKNFDITLDAATWAVLRSHHKLIISGDAEHSRVPLSPSMFNSMIAFSSWPVSWGMHKRTLPKYIGDSRLAGQERQLIVKEIPNDNK